MIHQLIHLVDIESTQQLLSNYEFENCKFYNFNFLVSSGLSLAVFLGGSVLLAVLLKVYVYQNKCLDHKHFEIVV